MNQKRVISAVAFIVIAIGAFVGGVQYQKHAGSTIASAANARGGFGPGIVAQRGARGVFGTVSAINGTTLTVTSELGTTTTYTVNTSASTTYTDGTGASTTASSLATGDTVIVQGTKSGTTVTATAIRINPEFGGGMGGGPTSGSADPNASTN
ncbi:hypothetical protein HJC99_00700 [Candidatus Saccharibacteria bacterium]|nr:hypothetical protein [Candidatus Saccharibacteria bacterium]